MKDKERDKRLMIPKDEFGEEAADGLGKLSRDEAADDLRELTGRLKRRLESRVRRPRRIWLPAAAAVVTLLVASALYISLFRERGEREPDVALAGEKGTATDSAGMAVDADTVLLTMAADSVSDTMMIAMATTPEEREEKQGGATMKSTVRADVSRGKGVTPPPQAGAEAVAVVTDDEVLEAVAEKVIADTPPPKGQVPAGEEVIVVALPAAQQEQQAAGVLPSVRQEEAMAAEEAAAAAPMTDKKSVAARAAAVRPDGPARPVGGWEAFNDWTRPNISHDGELKSEVTRLVVLAFKVRSDSTLYDLKVVKGRGDSYTTEALRLLREGPKWTPVIRNGEVVEEEVKISIMFK
jgi:hypothetical protein